MRPWRPRSLTARILLAEICAIAVAAVLLPLLMVSVLRRTSSGLQEQLLSTQARAVADGLRRDARGGWTVALPPALHAVYASSYDGRAFVVLDGGTRVVAASRFGALVPWQDAPREAGPRAFRAYPLAGVSLPVARGGHRFWVVVAQDESGPGAIVDDVIDSFVRNYSAILLGVLLLLPLVNSLLIRRLVISLRRVSAQATGIEAHSLDTRLAEGGLPSEVQPLVASINALLERLEQSFRQQQEFVANVAHELRTPLATLRVRLEGVEEAGVREPLDRQVRRLTHVVSQLHDLATLEDAATANARRFDLGALAAEIVEERAAALRDGGRTIDLVPAERPVEVTGNRFLVGIAIANLVENAMRHTPAGTHVAVTVAPGARVTVADDGPGLAAKTGASGRSRFWRADHVRSDSAGLGLSIVRRIAEVHGGTLEIGRADPRGAIVALHLPQERR